MMYNGTIMKTFYGPFCHMRARDTMVLMRVTNFNVTSKERFQLTHVSSWFRCRVELNYSSDNMSGKEVLAAIKKDFLPMGWKLHPHST